MLETHFRYFEIVLVGLVILLDVTREQFGVFDISIRFHFNRYHEETKAHDQHYHHSCPPLHILYATRAHVPDVRIAAQTI